MCGGGSVVAKAGRWVSSSKGKVLGGRGDEGMMLLSLDAWFDKGKELGIRS